MKKPSALLTFCLMLLCVLLAACAPAAAPTTVPASEMAAAAPTGTPAAAARPGEPGSTPAPRLVIRNAELTIVVKDPAVSVDAISRMAAQMDGFVVSSQLFKTSGRDGAETPQAEIAVRVPAAKLDDALRQIKSMVSDPNTDVLSENISGQDVTKDYTDQQSRLTNLENTEKQLQKIMDQAAKTEDVLAVYNQLVSVREQIEVIKGQVKYYEEAAALSSVTVHLRSQASIQPVSVEGWHPVGVARDAFQALLDAFRILSSAGIWLVIFLLPLGLFLGAFYFVLRVIWRKVIRPAQAGQNIAKPPAPPAPHA